MMMLNRAINRAIAFTAVSVTLTVLAFGDAEASGNAQAGLEKSTVCQSCHGVDGNLSLQDDYPKLGGQHYDYLVQALKAYRSGDRENAIMAGFAAGLSDQDIEDLAAWYASQDGLVDLSVD
jgi:cytochrome c553